MTWKPRELRGYSPRGEGGYPLKVRSVVRVLKHDREEGSLGTLVKLQYSPH